MSVPKGMGSTDSALLTRSVHSILVQDKRNRLCGPLASYWRLVRLVIPTPCWKALSAAFLAVTFSARCELLSI